MFLYHSHILFEVHLIFLIFYLLIQYDILPIETLYDAANNLLLPIFDGAKVDATEENIQVNIIFF